MNLREALDQLLKATDRKSYVVQDDVIFHLFRNDDGRHVINFDRRKNGDLNRLDVDWTRAVLADLGYTVVAEWLPLLGVSWLSEGVSGGVSFRVVKS